MRSNMHSHLHYPISKKMDRRRNRQDEEELFYSTEAIILHTNSYNQIKPLKLYNSHQVAKER